MTELNRPPTHTGEILKEDFLIPIDLTKGHFNLLKNTDFS